MVCGCCGNEAKELEKTTITGEDMYICDPCKPTDGGLCRVGYHIFNRTTVPARALVPPMVTVKKVRVKK